MSWFVIIFLFRIIDGAKNAEELAITTTRTYDIDVPGSNPIRIVEGEPLWETTATINKPRNKFEHRSFQSSYDYNHSALSDSDGNSDGRDALEDFLKNYAEKLRRNKKKPYLAPNEKFMENMELITKASDEGTNMYMHHSDEEDGEVEDDANTEDKSKSWNLLHHQKHNHPYEDEKGWVSMEPVPWSVSRISKWKSSQKNAQKPYTTGNQHYAIEGGYDKESFPRPSWSQKPFAQPLVVKPPYSNNHQYEQPDSFASTNRPMIKPIYEEPSVTYGQKVQIGYNKKNQHENCDHRHENSEEIIIDDSPSNFPQNYDTNRQRGTSEIRSDTHPFSGQGDWVLLSTTRGYKYPQIPKQRSLEFQPESIGTTRAVRLTVLPPLKNSKVNMTTSHGGLLQVESTFQTVEQAKNQFFKKQRQKQQQQTNKVQRKRRPQRQNQHKRPVKAGQIVAPLQPTAALTTTRRMNTDSSAVLAAVGAGMIPATMAMLLPIAMGGRRKRRDVKILHHHAQ